MLFIFKRYKHDDNKILASKNLLFLSITSFIIITQSFKFIIKDKLDKYDSETDSSKDIKKKSTSTSKAFKKKMIQKFDLLNIVEIDAFIYYHLTRNKENRLFFLIINKIYDTFIESFETLLLMKQDNRILVNDSYLYNFKIKYKKCCKSYTFKDSQINNIKILTS